MTLDEQIEILENNAEFERKDGDLNSCLNFRQLAEWLKDYKRLKEQQPCEDCISKKNEIVPSFKPSGDTHILKCLPQYFNEVRDRKKSFELRKDDRDYKVGDKIILKEWDGEEYTGREILNIKIQYILRDCPEYGLKRGILHIRILRSRREKMRIGRDSWNIIQRVIRRYPESKRKYQDALDAAMYPGASESKGDPYEVDPDYTKPVSITEAAALRLNSPYVQRLKKEIEAVETAFNNLDSGEQSLIRARFWVDQNKNQQYHKLFDLPYAERTMKRICRKFIANVGRNIGEIENE